MSKTENMKLAPSLIKDMPPSMYYISNFITEAEESHILDKIPPNRWISLSHRRLQAIPARLTASNALIISTGLPDWLLNPISSRFDDLEIFKDSPHGKVNHCLINEYLPGQGIMPHEDGAAYHPVVATVSLGGSIVLDVIAKGERNANDGEVDEGREMDDRKSWRVFQEPGSLLITTGEAYTETLHGIAEVEVDRGLTEATVANWNLLGDHEIITANGGCNQRTTRISLTYRDVLKESKVGSKIFGKVKS